MKKGHYEQKKQEVQRYEVGVSLQVENREEACTCVHSAGKGHALSCGSYKELFL